MIAITRIALLIATTILLTACGASKVAVKSDLHKTINTIALIKVSEPDAYSAQDFANPGMMFGATGGAVAGSSAANAGKNINQIAVEQKYAAGAQFTDLLNNKLTAAGYQVKVITVPRNNNHKLLESYDSVEARDADAILDVVIESIGYATEHPMFSPHWRPASQIQVALVDSRSGETIYAEKFMYGYHNPFMSGTDIDAPESYHFKNKEALFADSDKLIAGMQHSVEAVVSQVQNNLKK